MSRLKAHPEPRDNGVDTEGQTDGHESVRAHPHESHPGSLAIRLATGRTSNRLNLLGWIAFALGVILLCSQFWQGVNPQDEGEMLTYPWLISSGWKPYVDFWTMYPPVPFVILAGFFKIGIPGLIAERGLGLAVRLLCVTLINRAITGSWRRFSWIGIPVTYSLMFLMANISLAAYAWIAGLPLVLGGLLLIRRERLGLAALAFGMAGTFRIEFGVAGLVALASFAGLEWWYGTRKSAAWLPFLFLCLGLTTFYVALDAATGERLFQQMLVDPILRIEPRRRVSIFPPMFGPFGLSAALVLFIGPPILVLLGLRLRRPSLVATNLAVCTLLPQVLQVADWSHLFGVAALGVPWVLLGSADVYGVTGQLQSAVSTLVVSKREISRLASIPIAWIGVTVGAFYSLFVFAYALSASPLSPLSKTYIAHGPVQVVGSGRNMIIARTQVEARDDRAVINFLQFHGARRERVFVMPAALNVVDYNMTVLYYALDLHPASIYLEADPGLETQIKVQREISHELLRCAWVVLWKDRVQGDTPRKSPLGRYIFRKYHVVLENRTYRVLRRNWTAPGI